MYKMYIKKKSKRDFMKTFMDTQRILKKLFFNTNFYITFFSFKSISPLFFQISTVLHNAVVL